jgi:hypothetical protein
MSVAINPHCVENLTAKCQIVKGNMTPERPDVPGGKTGFHMFSWVRIFGPPCANVKKNLKSLPHLTRSALFIPIMKLTTAFEPRALKREPWRMTVIIYLTHAANFRTIKT